MFWANRQAHLVQRLRKSRTRCPFRLIAADSGVSVKRRIKGMAAESQEHNPRIPRFMFWARVRESSGRLPAQLSNNRLRLGALKIQVIGYENSVPKHLLPSHP